MGELNFINNKHLLWRAGFGIGLSQVSDLKKMNRKELLKELFTEDHSQTIEYTTADIEAEDYTAAKANADMRSQIQKTNQRQNQELNLNFLEKMVNSKNQLQEKMAFFWHGHFATRLNNPKFNKHQLNIIRKHALGNFRELLFEVSKSPAMLSFLNNQQNKKGHPNENFAREVMELFTMGIGNYTEKDIREAARAFTGWGFDKEANFIERTKQHDEDTKTFLGKTGNFTGDDVLNIILEQKTTAKFITAKIYKFFVNEKPDETIINELSDSFYHSNYDIKKLIHKILEDNPQKQFVYFSTCSIYDSSKNGSPYVLHKLKMEQIIINKASNYLILRVSNAVGKGGNPNLLMNYIYSSILNKKKITIHKNAKRNLIDVEDVVKISHNIISNNIKNKIINIAFKENIAIENLVNNFEKILKTKTEKEYIEIGESYSIDIQNIKAYFRNTDVNNYLENIINKYYK